MNRITYLLLMALAVYALSSVAIALATADKCGDFDAPKRWVIVPPEWKCGR